MTETTKDDVTKLKALAYDMIKHIEALQREVQVQVQGLQQVNQQIAEAENDANKSLEKIDDIKTVE